MQTKLTIPYSCILEVESRGMTNYLEQVTSSGVHLQKDLPKQPISFTLRFMHSNSSRPHRIRIRLAKYKHQSEEKFDSHSNEIPLSPSLATRCLLELLGRIAWHTQLRHYSHNHDIDKDGEPHADQSSPLYVSHQSEMYPNVFLHEPNPHEIEKSEKHGKSAAKKDVPFHTSKPAKKQSGHVMAINPEKIIKQGFLHKRVSLIS